jgi:photoactive yellow protein
MELGISSEGPVECAWCGKQIRPGDATQQKSHGICLPCMGFVMAVPIEDLSHIPPECFNLLPYGVVLINADGHVTGYNEKEAAISGLDPKRVLGKNFFNDIAPCTRVKQFAGELERMRYERVNAKTEIRFLFKFDRGTVMVQIVMVYLAISDSAVVMVKPLAQEPVRPS